MGVCYVLEWFWHFTLVFGHQVGARTSIWNLWKHHVHLTQYADHLWYASGGFRWGQNQFITSIWCCISCLISVQTEVRLAIKKDERQLKFIVQVFEHIIGDKRNIVSVRKWLGTDSLQTSRLTNRRMPKILALKPLNRDMLGCKYGRATHKFCIICTHLMWCVLSAYTLKTKLMWRSFFYFQTLLSLPVSEQDFWALQGWSMDSFVKYQNQCSSWMIQTSFIHPMWCVQTLGRQSLSGAHPFLPPNVPLFSGFRSKVRVPGVVNGLVCGVSGLSHFQNDTIIFYIFHEMCANNAKFMCCSSIFTA